jgi:hypothetical protein
MTCVNCGRDIDAIGQDNVSYKAGFPLCEDCETSDIECDYEEYEESVHPGISKSPVQAERQIQIYEEVFS